jgi:inhibitor of KinA
MNAWQLIWTSERSILARLPESVTQSDAASRLAAWISSQSTENIRSVIPSATGVLIEFNILHCPLCDSWSAVVQLTESFERDQCSSQSTGTSHAREILIPVCYDDLLAPDLLQVAQQLNCHSERIIELHTAVVYSVNAMGFMPGFGYLGALHDLLRIPRKDTPRTQVPAGSVAIAEDMTAVYPHQSAGGWHLIGRTPLQLFNPNQNEPSLLRVGDTVRFNQITYDEFNIYEETQQREDD